MPQNLEIVVEQMKVKVLLLTVRSSVRLFAIPQKLEIGLLDSNWKVEPLISIEYSGTVANRKAKSLLLEFESFILISVSIIVTFQNTKKNKLKGQELRSNSESILTEKVLQLISLKRTLSVLEQRSRLFRRKGFVGLCADLYYEQIQLFSVFSSFFTFISFSGASRWSGYFEQIFSINYIYCFTKLSQFFIIIIIWIQLSFYIRYHFKSIFALKRLWSNWHHQLRIMILRSVTMQCIKFTGLKIQLQFFIYLIQMRQNDHFVAT
ncbi:Hypothetical_protein [Hexamita inflata]|uniref:Hypothetical_protein n=1 Tax=Hexamita inflata TaxID=28002 RepID=A0AA86QW24_9EUKA|nr:Hypothetical protein HINF_LOCUS46240 [Hexamita inflata]